MNLDKLPKDTSASIQSVCESLVSNRLIELGFYPNQKVQVIAKAPFGGPLAVRIGNSTVMLRSAEAKCISVELSA